jgi:hypothetical protein
MYTSIRRRVRMLALAAAATLAAGTLTVIAALPASAAVAATVAVNAGQSLAIIPSTAFGVNVAVYDGHMNDSPVVGLLKGAGVDTVRYPGGSFADIYHWQTNTADGGFVAPNTDFDTYMGTVRSAAAQPIIIANYGSGTPQEAADWVRYANVTKGYGAKYWEIGNEVYGNGEYGSAWEADNHSSHSATTYANNLLQYVSAMKAVDSTIKIGAVLTTPGSWPDGLVGTGDSQDWNHTVMSIAGSKIDFVIVHWYPGGNSESDLLGKPQVQVAGVTSSLHSLINQYAGSNAANVGIAVTETNSTVYTDTQPGGLFAADTYLTWLENGVFNIDWWDLHNGSDCGNVTTVDGATDYNDFGVLSAGSSCEPAANTPFATYYGIQMLSKLGVPGDVLVTATSSASLLTAHAVRRGNGDVDVLFINKDPSNAYTANLSFSGFTPSLDTPTVYTYPLNGSSITSTNGGSASSQTIPAYSLVTVQLHPGGGTPSSSPSRTTSPSPSPTGGAIGACRFSYVKNEWPGGLTGNVTITNTGNTAVNGWTVTFSFPGDTTVTGAWNATVTQSGTAVTAKNASYNGTITPGANASFGFQGTWTSNDANPASLTLNGTTCTTS